MPALFGSLALPAHRVDRRPFVSGERAQRINQERSLPVASDGEKFADGGNRDQACAGP
jgi:hypothetical protein